MKEHRERVLKISASFLVGMMSFLFTVPVMIIIGGTLLGHTEAGYAFFSPQEVTLFLTSILVGLIVAAIVGAKYYQYQGKSIWK